MAEYQGCFEKMNISVAILAGGKSSRFGGKSKAEIIIEGKPIISKLIDTVYDISGEIIIVTNTPGKYSTLKNILTTTDIFTDAGPAGGLHAAIKATSADAVFLFGCDMPFLDRSLILMQIELFNKSNCDVTVPSVNGMIEPLHSIYSVKLLPVLEKFLVEASDYSLVNFISLVNAEYFKIDPDSPEARSFTNINSLSDIRKISKL